MEKASLGFAMGKHCHTALDRLYRVCIHTTLFRTWQEEGCLPRIKFIVQVD
jgi:hypothetical protein